MLFPPFPIYLLFLISGGAGVGGCMTMTMTDGGRRHNRKMKDCATMGAAVGHRIVVVGKCARGKCVGFIIDGTTGVEWFANGYNDKRIFRKLRYAN